MSLTNPLGDFEVSDPKTMRALAHPTRLAILSWLQRHGAATATQLSPHVGATPSVTSWHLRHLAGFGLVRDAEGGTDARQRLWEAAGSGFRFEAPADPDDAEGQAAYRALATELMATTNDLPRQWFATVEPELDADWRIESGVMNTRLELTIDELRDIGRQFEEILAAYANREAPADASDDRRGVRFLRYVMPEQEPSEAAAE